MVPRRTVPAFILPERSGGTSELLHQLLAAHGSRMDSTTRAAMRSAVKRLRRSHGGPLTEDGAR